MSTVTSVDPHWLAELGGVFYSVKEKGYSAREKRVTEMEFSRKMEIETKMAEDRERELRRLRAEEESRVTAGARGRNTPTPVMGPALRRVATQGAVKRPVTPRVGRGF
jgi:pre-mRNA-splicing factor ATP-dependent RNA helicase DHX38/PRP16